MNEVTRLRGVWKESRQKVDGGLKPKSKLAPRNRVDKKIAIRNKRELEKMKGEEGTGIHPKEYVGEKEWCLAFAYREGWWAGYLFDRKDTLPNIPDAVKLGIQLEMETEYQKGRKDGFLARKNGG